MKVIKFFTCFLVVARTALEPADAQIGYHRNGFGLALRNIPIETFTS
ncbi:unnamed protein product, partial [Allacma fusca]